MFLDVWILFFALILRYTINLMIIFQGKKKKKKREEEEEEEKRLNVYFNSEII